MSLQEWVNVTEQCLAQWVMYDVEARDFPGGPVVKNPPSNAGDKGSVPGWGTKIPHATGQLSLCATTREAHTLQLLSPCTLQPVLPSKRSLCTATSKSPCAPKKTQHSQKLKKKKKELETSFVFLEPLNTFILFSNCYIINTQ